MFSKLKSLVKIIYIIIGLHLSVYAVGFARYQVHLFSLQSRISKVVTLSEGEHRKAALSLIPHLQVKLPLEPKIYNLYSSIKSLFPYFDDYNSEAAPELNYLIELHKSDLSDVNLNGIIFLGDTRLFPVPETTEIINLNGLILNNVTIPLGPNFTNSNFKNIELIKSTLSHLNFRYSNFDKVNFLLAKMNNTDFAFSSFNGCNLSSVNLSNSNLCGSSFMDTNLNTAKLKGANLIGVDLSNAIFLIPNHKALEKNLQGAYYNSGRVNEESKKQVDFISYTKCIDNRFFIGTTNRFFIKATKFPEGFDPDKYGMIDISKWE